MIPPLSRRAVLRGAGAIVALPWLEAMRRSAWADDLPPSRLVVWFVPNGMYPPQFRPPTEGAGYQLSPVLQPLGALSSQVTVISGLANRPAMVPRAEEHCYCTGSVLTCVAPVPLSGASARNGRSMDQFAADVIGAGTPHRSLALGSESAGICTMPWCAGGAHISWSDANAPAGKLTEPRAVFHLLFGTGPEGLDLEQQQRRARYRHLIVDRVADDAQRLQARLGAADRQTLDAWLTGLFEVERRIDPAPASQCDAPPTPGDALDTPSHVAVMNELMALALQCGQTNVLTYMLGNARSVRPYPFLGWNGPHHGYSHHAGAPYDLAALQAIGAWEVARFAAFVQRLADVPEGNGTLLDHTAALFLSGMGDPDPHYPIELPVMVAGGAALGLNPGRHVALPTERPLAELHLELLAAVGAPRATFGADGLQPLGVL
jgi:hypothetical protein